MAKSPHPAYFTLKYDELLLGEEVTDAEFWRRYRPRPGRKGLGLLSGSGKDGGSIDSGALSNPETCEGTPKHKTAVAQT